MRVPVSSSNTAVLPRLGGEGTLWTRSRRLIHSTAVPEEQSDRSRCRRLAADRSRRPVVISAGRRLIQPAGYNHTAP